MTKPVFSWVSIRNVQAPRGFSYLVDLSTDPYDIYEEVWHYADDEVPIEEYATHIMCWPDGTPVVIPQTKKVVVCETCDDTNVMDLHYNNGDVRKVMCTRCPTPCQRCRQGGNGPFCGHTPCACPCHADDPRVQRARRG